MDDAKISQLLELGIGLDQAKQALIKSDGNLQKAIEWHFATNKPNSTNWMQWSKDESPQIDSPLLEGISASLREFSKC